MSEIEGIAKIMEQEGSTAIIPSYNDGMKKRMLLNLLQANPDIAHLVQHCWDVQLDYEQTCNYLRTNAITRDGIEAHLGLKKRTFLSIHDEENPNLDLEEATHAFHSLAQSTGVVQAFATFNQGTFRRDTLRIPDEIWALMEPKIQNIVNEIRKKVRQNRMDKASRSPKPNNQATGSENPRTSTIPDQYPSAKINKAKTESLEVLCNNLRTLDIQGEDTDEDVDDDALMDMKEEDQVISCGMARLVRPTNMSPSYDLEQYHVPPDAIGNTFKQFEEKRQAFLSYVRDTKVYAISDSGADSTLLGKHAKVLSYTGRYARILGYEPSSTQSGRVPIVTALIKARSTEASNSFPVLLRFHESAYLENNPVTLVSEYQVREYGLVIDSVAEKHQVAPGIYGTQSFYVNMDPEVKIGLEDRGGLMGFEILPILPGDEERYDIYDVTSNEPWGPI